AQVAPKSLVGTFGESPCSTKPQSTLWLAKETDMAENKTKPTSASVDDFIAAIENPRRRADALVSLAIYKEVTGLQPVMWGPSIIGFGSIHYVYETGRGGDMPAAGFFAAKGQSDLLCRRRLRGCSGALRQARQAQEIRRLSVYQQTGRR